ncbi:MAG: diaminopimelate decarboxylase [Acidimicrobiales bacterium]
MSPIDPALLPMTSAVGPEGGLRVGGIDLVELADRFGTPLFVYDEEHLRARCREAVAAWGGGVAYATKAFLCLAMARLVHEEGMCLDVSTGGELHVALASDVPADRLVLHGNNKSMEEIRTALAVGVGRIVVDSFDELDRLESLLAHRPSPTFDSGTGPTVRTSGTQPKVLVRITPGVEVHAHEFVRTGHDDSKFGFGIASGAADQVLDRLGGLMAGGIVELVGIHAHLGSQVFELEPFERAIGILARFFAPLGLSELVIGGGLGVAYVHGETAPTITEWATAVRRACRSAGLPDSVRVTAEPGRSIVASSGVTLYRVGTVKRVSDRRTYVSVDGGMSDNPRPVLYGSGYEAFLPREVGAERTKPVRVVGKHCESGDVIVADGYVPDDLAVGDVLATPVTGAYGHSMASNYNKVPRPSALFVTEGRAREVVRRETYADLIRLDT